MVTVQSVQGHTGLTHPSNFLTLEHSGAQSARVPKCWKFRNSGLDQYGTECFGRLIFATIRKSVGLKGLKCLVQMKNVALDFFVMLNMLHGYD